MKKQILSNPRLLLGVISLALLASVYISTQVTGQPSSQSELQNAWLRAGKTDRFAYESTVLQTTRPTMRIENAGRHPRTEEISISGQVDHGRDLLRFEIQEGDALPVAVRVEDGRAEGRIGSGGEWTALEGQPNFFGSGQDPLGYLAAAINVHEVTGTVEGDDFFESQVLSAAYSDSLTRYTFDLDSVRYARFMREQAEQSLRQTGKMPPGVQVELPAQYLGMEAQGSIWVNAAGLPVRQVVQMTFPPETGAYDWVEAEITTTYNDWSAPPPFTLANALRSPSHAMAEVAALAGVRSGELALSIEFLAAFILSSAFLMLFLAYRRTRFARVTFSAAIIGSMLLVPVLQADQVHAFSTYQREQQQQLGHESAVQAPADSIFNPLRNPLPGISPEQDGPQRVAMARDLSTLSVPAAAPLTLASCDLADPDLDCDEDLLTNEIEVYELGTNPSKKDSDGDNISDRLEVEGFFSNGQQWYLDPLNPDSNSDSLLDGLECPELMDIDLLTGEFKENFTAGVCHNTDSDTTPDVFDYDNDSDGVPDSIDGDPYMVGGVYNATDKQLNYEVTLSETGVPIFVDMEIRPTDSRHLAYTQNVLDWPSDDTNGQIQRNSDNTFADVSGYEDVRKGENGDIVLNPLLEYVITYDAGNPTAGLPVVPGHENAVITDYSDRSWLDEDELSRVGISARQGPDVNTLLLYAPLTVLRDTVGDAPVAWGTRMYYRPISGVSTVGQNTDIRLIWMIEALQDVCDSDCDDDNNWVTQSNVIQTYYEEFTVTALTVREDHGADLAMVAEPSTVGDTRYDDRLWFLADTLQSALLRVQLKNGGERFSVADLPDYLNTWGVSGLNVTRQTLNDQLDLLSVGALTGADGVTTGVDVLNTVHSGAAVNDMESLLFVAEETSRTLNMSEVYARSALGTETVQLDLNDATKDTVATMRVAPYLFKGNSTWEAADLTSYVSEIERALSSVFTTGELAKLATDENNIVDTIEDEAEARSGAIQLAESFYVALFIGLSSTAESDGAVYGSAGLGTYALGGNQAATLIVKSMVDEIQAFYEELSIVEALVTATNALPAANALSATFAGSLAIILETVGAVANGDTTSSLALSLQTLGDYYKTVDVDTVDFTDSTAISLSVWTSQSSQQNGGFQGTYITWKLISSAYTIKWAWGQWKAYQAAIQLAQNADDIVASLKAGAAANKIIKVSNAWAVVTFVFTVAIIWGMFLISSFENQMQRSAAIARAIGQTIVAVILFAIALIPIVGWIIVGIIALIDALMMAICAVGREVSDAFEEGSDEDVWVCDGLSGAVAMAIVYLIFETFVPYDVDADDRMTVGLDTPQVEQLTLNDGYVVGNAVTVTAQITNTFHLDEPEMLIIKTTYTDSQLRDLGKKSVFGYSMTPTGTNIHDSLSFDTLDWTNNQETFETSINVPLQSAGINEPMAVYLNEGLNLNTVECWGFIGANEDWTCYDGSDDAKYTYKDTVSSYMGDDLQFDVLPPTFAGFVALSGNGDGYRLNWDTSFPILRDADGDDLISSTYGGADVDDGFWDADGDGLTDLWEEENGYDALDPDMDDDGLWDYWEAFFGTDAGLPDTDGDGLTDNDELFHSMARHAFTPDNSTWQGGWTIDYADGQQTRVSADPFDFDSDDDTLSDNMEFIYGYHPDVPSILNVLSLDAGVLDDVVASGGTVNYEATVTNELSNRYANGLLQAEFPVDVVQRTQVLGSIGPGQSATLNGSVAAPSVSETTATSITIRAGAVIEPPGPERLLWLQMNEAAGATSFADLSTAANGPHNGTCSGGTCPTANDAFLDFDANDQVVVADDEDFDLDHFSVSLNVSFDNINSGTSHIIAKGNTFNIRANGSSLIGTVYLDDCSTAVNLNSGALTIPTTWVYLTLTHDGETATIYVNGVEAVSTPAASVCANNSNIVLGSAGFDGQLDEVEIFGEALSPAYIAEQYQKPVFYLADLPAQGGSPAVSNDDLPESPTHLQCNNNSNGYPSCPSSTDGVIGDGISLDAKDGYWMWFAPDLGINDATFSMAMWINPANNYSPNNKHFNTHGQLIFGNTENGFNQAYPSLFAKGKKLLVRFGHDELDGYCEAESSNILTYNTWQHLAVTFDGTLFRAYVDKELADTFSGVNCAGETPTKSTSIWDIAFMGNGVYPALYFDNLNITDNNSSWIDDPEFFIWADNNIYDNGVQGNSTIWVQPENTDDFGEPRLATIDEWAYPKSLEDITFALCEYDPGTVTYNNGCTSIAEISAGTNPPNESDAGGIYEPTPGIITTWKHEKTHDHLDAAGSKTNEYIQDLRNLYTGVLTYALYNTGFKGDLDEIRLYNTALSDLGVEAVYNTGIRALDMKFDEAPGKSTFGDDSLNAFTAGCSGTSCPDSGIPGRANQAVRFDGGLADDDGNDGVADYMALTATDSQLGIGANDFTVAAWIKPDNVSGLKRIVAAERINSANGFGFGLSGNQLLFTTYGIKDYVANSVSLSADVWSHVAVSLDENNDASFFVNGSFVQKVTGSNAMTANTDDDYRIGASTPNGGGLAVNEPFDGLIDHVVIEKIALGVNGVQSIMRESPVLNLHLDENLATTTFVDDTQYANAATCTNCPEAGFKGQMREAPVFDGVDDLLQIADSNELDMSTFSVGLWVKPTQQKSDYQPLITKQDSSGTNRNFGLFIEPDSMDLYFSIQKSNCSAWVSETAATPLLENQWNHVVMTYDGGQTAVYINGSLQGSKSYEGTPCQNDHPIKIGDEVNVFTAFAGSMDEVFVSGKALDAAGVDAVYDYQSSWYDLTYQQSIMLDANAPEILYTSVTHGGYLPLEDTLLAFGISDDDAVASVRLDIDTPGGMVVVQALPGDDENNATWFYNFQPTVGGPYDMDITATDAVGNSTTVRRLFFVDGLPPVGSLEGFFATQIQTSQYAGSGNRYVALSGFVNDPAPYESLVVDDSVTIEVIDQLGRALKGFTDIDAIANSGQWWKDYPMMAANYGRYTVNGGAADSVQNSFSGPLGTFMLDDIGPRGDVILATDRLTPTRTIVGSVNDVPYPAQSQRLHLHFEEAAGATSFVDGSRNQHLAACASCPTTGQTGLHGLAAQFAPGNALFIAADESLELTDGTLMAWINPVLAANGHGYNPTILAMDNGSQVGYRWQIADDYQSMVLNNGSETKSVAVSLTPNAWNHLALVMEGGVWTGYVNGIAAGVGITQTFGSQTNLPLFIGGNHGGSNGFTGLIDEVAIYDRPLTDDEINDIADPLNGSVVDLKLRFRTFAERDLGEDEGTWHAIALDDTSNNFSTWSFNVPDMAEGGYKIDLKATDALGNESYIGDAWSGFILLPDLSVSKTASVFSVLPGDPLAYTITYTNSNRIPAIGVTITETVPVHTVFDAAASDPVWSCAAGGVAGDACTAFVPYLSRGGVGTIGFAVDVLPPAVPANQETISNTVRIDSLLGDTDESNNSYGHETPLIAAPDLSVQKIDAGEIIPLYGSNTYTITYANAVTATQSAMVVLTETIPAYTAPNYDTLMAWDCPGTNIGDCTLAVGEVLPGGIGVANFTVNMKTGNVPPGEIVNIVQVGNEIGEADLVQSDNSWTVTTPVAQDGLTIAVDPVTVSEGMTATNYGSVIDYLQFEQTQGPGTMGESNGEWTWEWQTTDGPEDSTTVGLYLFSYREDEIAASFEVIVENMPPSLTLSGADSSVAGVEYSLSLSDVFDPGDDTVTTCTIHWGDGSSEDCLSAIDGHLVHTYTNAGTTPTISVDLVDEDGTYAGVDAKTISVTDGTPPELDGDNLPIGYSEAWHHSTTDLRLGLNKDLDDSVALFSAFDNSGSYQVQVQVTNELDVPAQLVGWIDFDGSGDFSNTPVPGDLAATGERSLPRLADADSCLSVADDTFTTGNIAPDCSTVVTLKWNVPGTPTAGATYARIRLTTDAAFFSDSSPQPTGVYGLGETEGHIVNEAGLAVTLASFTAFRDGETVVFQWQTATETGVAGFNVLAKIDGEQLQLNDELIPSTAIDSVTPLEYAFVANTVATNFFLEEVNIQGLVTVFGPFGLSQEPSSPDATEMTNFIWLPFVANGAIPGTTAQPRTAASPDANDSGADASTVESEPFVPGDRPQIFLPMLNN